MPHSTRVPELLDSAHQAKGRTAPETLGPSVKRPLRARAPSSLAPVRGGGLAALPPVSARPEPVSARPAAHFGAPCSRLEVST